MIDITDVGSLLALDFWHMLSEKQFRERAKSELRQIANQVLSVATDRDIYWRLEREIIQPNPQLRDARSAFLDLLRGTYADATAARVLRLLDGQDSAISLPRVLAQLANYPQLLHDRITEQRMRRRSGRAGAGCCQPEAGDASRTSRIMSGRCRRWPPRIAPPTRPST